MQSACGEEHGGQDVGLREMGGLDGNPTAVFPSESLDFAWFLVPADSEKKTQTSQLHINVLSTALHIQWTLSKTIHLI